MKYIQNRTNWCWVAACKVAGEQYKKNFVDAWQSAIARNADFLHGGLEGKSGDGGSGQQSGWTAYRYCKKKK